MDILLLVILTVAVVVNIISTTMNLRELKRESASIRSEIESTRQARMKSFVRSTSTPAIDSRGRTTKRDSDDIPVRGARMITLAHKRKPSDRTTDDDRLPDNA